MTRLRESDIRIIGNWLSPDYLIPAARSYAQDEVLGAHDAYREVRSMIREYARFVRFREGAPEMNLELAQALRAMGYVGIFQPVARLDSDWHPTAEAMWAGANGEMRGWTQPIEVGSAPQSMVNRAALMALGRLFKVHGELNLAHLRGRLYLRKTVQIMVNIEAGSIQGPRSYIINPCEMDSEAVRKRMRRARMAVLKAEEHALRYLSFQLTAAWAKTGMIASPASAMISFANQSGHAPLAPFNGIPISVQVGAIRDSSVVLYCTFDHRVFDGSHAGVVYRFLEDEVKRCV